MAMPQFFDDSQLSELERSELRRILFQSKPVVQFSSNISVPENSESDGHSVCRPTPSGAKCVSETSHSGQKIPSVTAVKSVNSTKDGSIGSVQKLERFDNHVGNVLKSVVQTDPARLAALAAQNALHSQFSSGNSSFFSTPANVPPEFAHFWWNLVASGFGSAGGHLGTSGVPIGYPSFNLSFPHSNLLPQATTMNGSLGGLMFCPTDLSYFPSPRSPPHPNLYVEASHMSYGSLSEEENGRSNDIGEVLASNVTGPNHTAQSQSSNSPGESDLHHSEIDSSRDGSPEIVIMANKLLANQKSPVHPSTGVTFGDIPSVSDSSNCPIVQEDPTDLVTAGADIDQCVQTLSSTEEHPTMLPTRNPASDTQSDDYFEDAVDEISEDIANGSKTQSKDLQFTDDVQLEYKIEASQQQDGITDSKPKSWASLFANTKTAAAAKVINSAENETLLNQMSIVNGTESEDSAFRKAIEASIYAQAGVGSSDFSARSEGLPVVPVDQDCSVSSIVGMIHSSKIQHKGASFQLRGLTNCGNSCYVNAVLQALIACPPFFNLLRSLAPAVVSRTKGTSTPVLDSLVRFVCEFVGDKSKTNRSKVGNRDMDVGKPLDPVYIHRMVSRLKPDAVFKGHHQEDAEEFLGAILNALQEELVKCANFVRSQTNSALNPLRENSSVADTGGLASENADEWQEVGCGRKTVITREAKFEISPISMIFVGKLRYSMQLPVQGAKESVSLQPFFTLPLEIQADSIESVTAALQVLASKEVVKGVSGGKNVKEQVDGQRGTAIEELPVVLILQLKYFFYDESGPKKIVKDVRFDVDLTVRPEILSVGASRRYQGPQRHYKLFAVVYHLGDKAGGGHYTSAVYHGGGWVSIDDSRISSLTETELTTFEPPRVPYLLFYRRLDSLISQQN